MIDKFIVGGRYRASNGRFVTVLSISKGWMTFQDSDKRQYRRKIQTRRPMSGYEVQYVDWEKGGGKRYPSSWIEADKRRFRKNEDRW